MRGEWFTFHEIMDELLTLEVAPMSAYIIDGEGKYLIYAL
jgi:hypothetical protein